MTGRGRRAAAPAPLARLVSWERVADRARSSFWLIPAVCVLASIALGIAVLAIDEAVPSGWGAWMYPGPTSSARDLLVSVITAMISFTGLVFSVTIVVLQLTSGQFSPRALRMFVRDRTIQLTLGVFLSTFVFAMVVQRGIKGTDGSHDVPRLSLATTFVLVLASVGLFVRYISHVANMVRVATIIAEIGDESRRLVRRDYPAETEPRPDPPAPETSIRIDAPRSGVLVALDEPALARIAKEHGCLLAVPWRCGDFVPVGAALVEVAPPEGAGEPDGLRRAVLERIALDSERTMEQDLAFGFRQLVDIAERALSPAVNDPTTACQCVDAAHDLLRRLATRPPAPVATRDDEGTPRLWVRRYQVADLLDFTVGEIWHYGEGAAQVPARLRTLLADLADAARPEHAPAIQEWRARVTP